MSIIEEKGLVEKITNFILDLRDNHGLHHVSLFVGIMSEEDTSDPKVNLDVAHAGYGNYAVPFLGAISMAAMQEAQEQKNGDPQ